LYLSENYAVPFKKENKNKENGDIIEFIKKKDYVMVNKNLGCGSFGKTVLLQDTAIDELFVA
jgi:serine/threonine-protein kinase